MNAAQHDFGVLQRWLHRLALNSTGARRLAFELEATFLERGGEGRSSHPLYLCGLARSGTTLLLSVLDRCGDFASLSYRDMPFVMSPNMWAALSGRWQRRAVARLRLHGDGVVVDHDSPEAFEEVFWRTFDERLEREEACYGGCPPQPSVMAEFTRYRGVVEAVVQRRTGEAARRRYLSKNNNNLMRLQALCGEPGATALLMFRDPVATARSLRRTHARLVGRADGFTRDYMKWLGHFEFGPGHRPFCFARRYMSDGLQPSDADYWLDYWTAVHRSVLEDPAPVHLIDYDSLCRSPVEALHELSRIVGARSTMSALASRVRPPRHEGAPVEFDPTLVARARVIHGDLRRRCAAQAASTHV